MIGDDHFLPLGLYVLLAVSHHAQYYIYNIYVDIFYFYMYYFTFIYVYALHMFTRLANIPT